MSSPQLPEDPAYTSEPKILSPVSPKPLHFPGPDNIPVLQNQIDLHFNQMDTHMNGAAAESAGDGVAQTEGLTSATQDGAEQPSVTTNGDDLSNAASLDASAASNNATHNTQPAPPSGQVDGVSDVTVAEGASLQSAIPPQPTPLSTSSLPQQNESSTLPDLPDYQALLNSLSAARPKADLEAAPSYIPLDEAASSASVQAPPGIASAASGLPPRPPPQAQPSIHSNYLPTNDLSQFHPGIAPPAPGQAFPINTNGLPPPPVASFQQPPPSATRSTPQMSPSQLSFGGQFPPVREGRPSISGTEDISHPDDHVSWSPETKNLYEMFLEQERDYVTEGNWEQFPYGSRLFVGNLSSERVTKRDVFHVFHRYGKLAQISIKQAYGFVQFLNAADCGRAMENEQGRIIRGKRINLEISKPQKNRAGQGNNNRRRSRSPDRSSGVDRYAPGGRQSDGGRRGRDDYRPNRSPSPRGYRDRSRDRHGRYRSRSRSPHGRSGRHRSADRRRDDDDDLPLPRRAPRDIPDVQIILVDELDRNFVQYIERTIAARGVKVDVLLLSPRLSEAAVIKRQIVEGVTAVSRLTRLNQQIGKIPLQIFDRRGGADVRFEEYADLDPSIAAEVVLREKAKPQPSYGYGYGATAAAPPPPGYGQAPPPGMDPASLQKLLGGMQPGQAQAPGMAPDLARLLAAGGQQGQAYGQPGAQDPLAALRGNPALAGLLGGQAGTPQAQQAQQGPSQAGGQPNMADILAKLGTYRR